MPEKKTGRQANLTDTKIKQICKCIKLHMSWKQIAAFIGVSPRTLRRWRIRGHPAINTDSKNPDDKMYRKFIRAIAKTEAEINVTRGA